ncbi:Sensor kinase CusS [compost metagenome]
MAEYFEAVAADRDVTVAVSGAATVTADRTLLRRAIINLLDNALRHAPAGSTVRVAVGRGRPGFTDIRVANAGPAIAPESLPHLFGRFYRADPSRRNSATSTGLGLAIVDTIMRLHGGSVTVRSDAVQTEFEIDFPDALTGGRAGA